MSPQVQPGKLANPIRSGLMASLTLLFAGAGTELLGQLRQFMGYWRKPGPLLSLAVFVAIAAAATRLDLNPQGFPSGTNALDTYLAFMELRRIGPSVWYPLTDWGQPYPGFPGVNVLYPLVLTTSPTAAIRTIEFACIALSGVSAFDVCRRFTTGLIPPLAAGSYYLFAAETGQFFEGHIPLVISYALAPWFFYGAYVLFRRPSFSSAVGMAGLLYVLSSAGELGGLYMILFFSILIGFTALASRLFQHPYSRKEIGFLLFAIALTVVLFLPFLLTYAGGVRPEYTTTITSPTLAFQGTSGSQFSYATLGFIADNSYTYYGLHSFDYSLLPLPWIAIFYAIPALVLLYVIFVGPWQARFLFYAGVLAMAFSTGNNYPLLSGANALVYDQVPFFDSSPALFRWVYFTTVAYTFLLALSLQHLIQWYSRQSRVHSRPHGTIRSRRDRLAYAGTKWAAMILVGVMLVVPPLEYGEVFTAPPTSYEYPAAYTAGYAYIGHSPTTGSVLSIPFGNLGSRAPWGLVSGSSELASPYFTGTPTVIFEAGTPQSLAMDRFVGDGTINGYSNNISKFLAAANVEYVVATNYTNWSYTSSPVYDPVASYDTFANQTGLSAPVYSNGIQSVRQVPYSAGNISLASVYYVYFGNASLLYEILNSAWYTGTNTPLVDGENLSVSDAALVEDSSGLVTGSSDLANIPDWVVRAAASESVPLIVFVKQPGSSGRGLVDRPAPFVASGGVEYYASSTGAWAGVNVSSQELLNLGYSHLTVSARLASAAFSTVSVRYGNSTADWVTPASVLQEHQLPWTNTSVVSAGINNQGKYPYNGSVHIVTIDGLTYLEWNITPNNSTFQSINFSPIQLTNTSELSFQMRGASQLTFLLQANFNRTYMNVYSSESTNTTNDVSTFFFDLRSGAGPHGPNYSEFARYSDNLTLLAIGLPQSGAQSALLVSNFTGYLLGNVSVGFQNENLTEFPLSQARNLTLMFAGEQAYDFLALTFSSDRLAPYLPAPALSYTSEQTSSVDLSFQFATTRPGLLILDQVYSPLWNLVGAEGLHVTAEIGLNAWLVFPNSARVDGVISFQGQAYLTLAYVGQIVGLPFVVAVGVIFWSRHRP